MLQVDKLHQYYGGSHILRGLSFEAKVGEVTCLLGRNGVGKTTLLRCLMGLVPAREGQVAWEGRSLTGLRPHQRVRAGIAYVPQGREIFPRLTVEENLLMGLSRFSARDARAVPDFIYELFPVLREMKQRRGGDAERGEARVGLDGRAQSDGHFDLLRKDEGIEIASAGPGCASGSVSQSVQIATSPRTPSLSMSRPRPCWTISPRAITRYWSASSAAKS